MLIFISTNTQEGFWAIYKLSLELTKFQTFKVEIKKVGKQGQGQSKGTKSTRKHITMAYITMGVKLTMKHRLFELE